MDLFPNVYGRWTTKWLMKIHWITFYSEDWATERSHLTFVLYPMHLWFSAVGERRERALSRLQTHVPHAHDKFYDKQMPIDWQVVRTHRHCNTHAHRCHPHLSHSDSLPSLSMPHRIQLSHSLPFTAIYGLRQWIQSDCTLAPYECMCANGPTVYRPERAKLMSEH